MVSGFTDTLLRSKFRKGAQRGRVREGSSREECTSGTSHRFDISGSPSGLALFHP